MVQVKETDKEKNKQEKRNPPQGLSVYEVLGAGYMGIFEKWFRTGTNSEQAPAAKKQDALTPEEAAKVAKKAEDVKAALERHNQKVGRTIIYGGGVLLFLTACAGVGYAITQNPSEVTKTPEPTPAPVPTETPTPDDVLLSAAADPSRWSELLGKEIADKLIANVQPSWNNEKALLDLTDGIKAGYGIAETAEGLVVNFGVVVDGDVQAPCGTVFLEVGGQDNPDMQRISCEGPEATIFIATKDSGVITLSLPPSADVKALATRILIPGKDDEAIAFVEHVFDVLSRPAVVETPEGSPLPYTPESAFLERATTQCEIGIDLLRQIAAGTEAYMLQCGPFHHPQVKEGEEEMVELSVGDANTLLTAADKIIAETGVTDLVVHWNAQGGDKSRFTIVVLDGNGDLLHRYAKTADGQEIPSADIANWWPVISGVPSEYLMKPIELPPLLPGERLSVRWANDNKDSRYLVIESAIGQVHWVEQVSESDASVKFVENPYYFDTALLPPGIDMSNVGVLEDISQLTIVNYANIDAFGQADVLAVITKGEDNGLKGPPEGAEWAVDQTPLTYEEQIAASPDRFVCLPEYCLFGKGEIDQAKAETFMIDMVWSYVSLEGNKEFLEGAGFDVSSREAFEASLKAHNNIVPAGLKYLVPNLSKQTFYSMSQDTWPEFSVDKGIFEVLDTEALVEAKTSGRIKNIEMIQVHQAQSFIQWGLVLRNINGINYPAFIIGTGFPDRVFIQERDKVDAEEAAKIAEKVNAMYNFMPTLAPLLQFARDKGDDSIAVKFFVTYQYPYSGILPDEVVNNAVGNNFQRISQITSEQIFLSK